MIRPFHLRDLLLVRRLQKEGTPLDIEEQLTQPRSPLTSVLIEKLFKPRTNSSTYILNQQNDNHRVLGLVQLRTRPGHIERDVVFVAPKPDVGNGVYLLWQRLLTHACVETAEQGGMRVFARLPEDNSSQRQLFKSVGFAEYGNEDVFQLLPENRPPDPQPTLSLRAQERADGWRLQKLYGATTPRQTQNAEGQAQGRWALPQQRWQEQGMRYGYVWEVDGELMGAVHLRVGRYGVWIKTLLHPNAVDKTEMFAETCLWLAKVYTNRPIYFAVRQYEAGWTNILPELGFTPFTTQTLVVKHMAVQVRKALPVSSVLSEIPVVGGQSPMVGSQITVVNPAEEV